MAQSLSNLPVSAKVKFGKYSVNGEVAQPIVWTIVAKNHSGYPSNTVTLLTSQLIDRMAFDSLEPGTTIHMINQYGSNRYSLSNIEQWLNSDKGGSEWYVAAHPSDSPPTTGNVTANAYYNKPGFLNAFSEAEKNAIINTTISARIPDFIGSTPDTITRKVFLASGAEVGIEDVSYSGEGNRWSHFSGYSRQTSLTKQAQTNLPSEALPNPVESPIYWWLRTAKLDYAYYVQCVDASGDSNPYTRANEIAGVRPALNLPSSASVSDTADADGCYTFIWNNAPPAPTTLNVPSPLIKGRSVTISWSPVVDPDDDLVQYLVDTYDGNEWLNSVMLTTYPSYTATINSDVFQVRVRAIDSKGAMSDYITSQEYTVRANTIPMVSAPTLDAGTPQKGFQMMYTVSDPDGDNVTVEEYLDNEVIRSYVLTSPTSALPYFVTISDTAFAKLKNGKHTITIRGTDAYGASRDCVITFIKNISVIEVLTAPMVSETMPKRISLSVSKDIPSNAIFKVEVCNNGNDSKPTWEDATSSVIGAMVHVFENTSKTSAEWAIRIKVSVDRNGASGTCHISRIGGNYE